MAKRIAAHRGPYRKTTAPMPLLLRRALAQLRGDPPESWPNALRTESPPPGAPYGPELYGPDYPFPTLAPMLPRMLPAAPADLTQGVLRIMLERLQKSDIGSAWKHLEAQCAATKQWPKDPGLEVLRALIEALVPINLLDSAFSKKVAEDIQKSAHDLLSLLEAFASAGAPLRGIMPMRPTELPGIREIATELDFIAGLTTPRGGLSEFLFGLPAPTATLNRALTDPAVLLALLRSLAEREIGNTPQRRGSMDQRRALTIARCLAPLAGTSAATDIANAATGARITAKAITKKGN